MAEALGGPTTYSDSYGDAADTLETTRNAKSIVTPQAHVGISQISSQTVKEMLAFVKSHGLEGIIAKRSDSVYEPAAEVGCGSSGALNAASIPSNATL